MKSNSENPEIGYTSQDVEEFWNVCTRPLDRNGCGLSPRFSRMLCLAFVSTMVSAPLLTMKFLGRSVRQSAVTENRGANVEAS
jgi:hypothetical protein